MHSVYMTNHRPPDGVRTSMFFAEGPQIPYILPYVVRIG